MGWLRVLFLAAVGGVAAWQVFQRSESLPRPLAKWVADRKSGFEAEAIRRSACFLRSQGAVQTASQAEQEALMAHRVTRAITASLGARAKGISTVVIGRFVHLEGQVSSESDRIEAERVAREASGARVVADDLVVAR